MPIFRTKTLLCTMGLLCSNLICADNQTPTVSTILPGNQLPFNVSIELSDFVLPSGFHSGVSAEHHGDWLFLAGRTNGMHGFEDDSSNFPPQRQNTRVYVINFDDETVFSRSLYDPGSGLSQHEIDLLTVTSPQSYQSHHMLYMTGGYGVITETGQFNTKDALTAINVPGLIHWVKNPSFDETAKQHIRYICHPLFQVTGGFMTQSGHEPTLLIFGQNFEGFYFEGGNGKYVEQVRRFKIHDDGHHLSVDFDSSVPSHRDPNFRRRDLNIVPFIRGSCDHHDSSYEKLYVALSGVFTLTGGAWTVPVVIKADGHASMANPNLSSTFKQGMNNYVCPTLGLFSKHSNNMYTTLFGGISFGFFSDGTITGTFETDPELPFINQVTTVKCDKHGHFSQYLMEAAYPEIFSTGTNPGNQLLFGAAAYFIPVDGLPTFSNGVINLDALPLGSTLVGYIFGGIQSTLPNTNTISDSNASPYIFKVYVNR